MRYWLSLLLILALSATSSAGTDIVGKIGKGMGFTGRNMISGGIGTGSPPPPTNCNGVINASVGCPLPMLGM